MSIEEAINGVEDMTYMTSTASNAGSVSITVYFKQGTDPVSYTHLYKSSGTYFFLLGLVTVCDFFIARLMAREAIPWLRKAPTIYGRNYRES